MTPLDTWLNQTRAADGTLTLYWNVNGTSLNADWQKPTLDYVKNNEMNSFPDRAGIIELPTQGEWVYWVIRSVPGNPYNVQVPHPIRKFASHIICQIEYIADFIYRLARPRLLRPRSRSADLARQ
jgi:hypothetical protein